MFLSFLNYKTYGVISKRRLKNVGGNTEFSCHKTDRKERTIQDNLAVQILNNLNVEFAAFFHFALLIESELKGLADLIEMKSAILVISLIV